MVPLYIQVRLTISNGDLFAILMSKWILYLWQINRSSVPLSSHQWTTCIPWLHPMYTPIPLATRTTKQNQRQERILWICSDKLLFAANSKNYNPPVPKTFPNFTIRCICSPPQERERERERRDPRWHTFLESTCWQELTMTWNDTQFSIKFLNELLIPLTMKHNIILSSPPETQTKNGELAGHDMPFVHFSSVEIWRPNYFQP